MDPGPKPADILHPVNGSGSSLYDEGFVLLFLFGKFVHLPFGGIRETLPGGTFEATTESVQLSDPLSGTPVCGLFQTRPAV